MNKCLYYNIVHFNLSNMLSPMDSSSIKEGEGKSLINKIDHMIGTVLTSDDASILEIDELLETLVRLVARSNKYAKENHPQEARISGLATIRIRERICPRKLGKMVIKNSINLCDKQRYALPTEVT